MAFLYSEEGALPTKPCFPERKLLRLRGFDYSSNGGYFVTINTKHRKPFFGEIQNGIMGLSEIGDGAWKCWYDIPNHYPFVIIDEFVVMPDHVHGILFIYNNNHQTERPQDFVAPPNQNPGITNKFGPQSKNLASIIRGFKIGVTKDARKSNPFFSWQSRFHDRIIRDEIALNRIRQYIKNNPKNWGKNKYEL